MIEGIGVRVGVGVSAASAVLVELAVAVEGSEVLNGDLTTFKTESAKSPEVLTPRTRISCQSFHEKMSTGLKTVIKNTIIVREMRRFFFFIGTPSSFHPYA